MKLAFSMLTHCECLLGWYRQTQELSTFENSAALGRGSKLGVGVGREKRVVFFFFLSIEQGHLQCTTVCEQSYGLWYHLARMDGLCCPDLTGQWTTSGCRWSAPRLPCIKKGWKIKLSVAIVDIFTPCLEVPMATESCDPLVEVGNLLCRSWAPCSEVNPICVQPPPLVMPWWMAGLSSFPFGIRLTLPYVMALNFTSIILFY